MSIGGPWDTNFFWHTQNGFMWSNCNGWQRGISMTHFPIHQEPYVGDWSALSRDAFPEDPIRALEEALRAVRGAPADKDLDDATRKALHAIAEFGHAVVKTMKHLEHKIEAH